MNEKNKTIDDYIIEAKTDIYVYIIVAFIILFFLLFFSYKVKFYYLLIVSIFPFLSIFTKIEVYHRVKRVKQYLIKNSLLDKIGKIDYWNNECYFLTENYMIFITKKSIDIFSYSDIKEIEKEINYKVGSSVSHTSPTDYLHIILNDNRQYKVAINIGANLVNEDVRDISSYLLEKNKKIKEKESLVKIGGQKL